MATTREIIASALLLIGVIPSRAEVPNEEAADALRALNNMMFAWKRKGLTYEHTALTVGATFPLPESLHDGVIAMLAERLAPEYGVRITDKLKLEAADGRTLVNAQYWGTVATITDVPGSRSPQAGTQSYETPAPRASTL